MSFASGIAAPDGFEAFLEQNLDKELLRFTTAGSVDDGKSTLIGRLLHDAKAVYEDQLASVEKSRINRSSGPVDFSLLTDGLRAEREQGITIDVGYRYFSTSRRKFIIADTPGHEQYTRNMATGASTADLAVILVDGTKGLLPQTLRHAYIASLLGIPNVLAAINKMDLVNYGEEEFLALKDKVTALARRLGIPHVQCIPVSALAGDNVVERGTRMEWYAGPTVLEHLEAVPIVRSRTSEGFRFPVQYVIRPDAKFRGFAGQVAGGAIRPGASVTAVPSGQRTRVASIVTYDGELSEASAGMSVTLKLADEIDLSRGDMLVSPDHPPHVSGDFAAMLVWMTEAPLESGQDYLIKHTTRQVRGRVARIRHRVDVNTLERQETRRLHMNDIAAVEFHTYSPLFFDLYRDSRATGSFILIDTLTNRTVAAGMIEEDLSAATSDSRLTSAPFEDPLDRVSSLERQKRHGHSSAIFLAHGRRALARALERGLFDRGFEVVLLEQAELSSASVAATTALYAAGFVVICDDQTLGAQEESGLRRAAGERFFDLANLNLSGQDEEALREIVAIAESLRTPGDTGWPRKGN
jgi:sulfate adenylyltransferase subunit 1